jgi:hypothetical protein
MHISSRYGTATTAQTSFLALYYPTTHDPAGTMSALPIPQRELFINGRWVQPVRGKYLDVVSPTSESVIGRIAAGSVEDVEAAVAAAVAAHKNGSWARSSGKQRAVVLRALAEKVGEVMLLRC